MFKKKYPSIHYRYRSRYIGERWKWSVSSFCALFGMFLKKDQQVTDRTHALKLGQVLWLCTSLVRTGLSCTQRAENTTSSSLWFDWYITVFEIVLNVKSWTIWVWCRAVARGLGAPWKNIDVPPPTHTHIIYCTIYKHGTKLHAFCGFHNISVIQLIKY